jgi:hypothetical protein
VIRKQLPVFQGAGQIKFLGHSGPADYAIEGDPTRLRPGVARLRGSISVSPELAKQAFRAGEGTLMLESGEQLRMTMLGHSDGGGDVFVEVRV